MREVMQNRGLTVGDVAFAVGLSAHTVEKVLNGNSDSGRYVSTVKKYLAIPSAINVHGHFGSRCGGLGLYASNGEVLITKAGQARGAYLKVVGTVYKEELVEGTLYYDGSRLILWSQGKWWIPTPKGVMIHETAMTHFYTVTHM